MAVIYQCDRCGSESREPAHISRININLRVPSASREEELEKTHIFDVCNDCKKQVVLFMKGEVS